MATVKQYSSTTDTGLQNGKAAQQKQQFAEQNIKTVKPDNETGIPGEAVKKPQAKDPSNVGKGPAGENL